MTRKDIILVAVIINAGLLAVLFATAIIYDTDKVLDQADFPALVENTPLSNHEPHPQLIAVAPSGDEVDNVLRTYKAPTLQFPQAEPQPDVFINEPVGIQPLMEDDDNNPEMPIASQKDVVEITVKKGDSLDKIARANNTTVSAIKKLNELKSEKLKIGQVLKIPVKKGEQTAAANGQTAKREENSVGEAQYYIIKSGDSPWKIAKQHNIKYEDILRLNQLDEEKARNLKIGDRIRIK